MFQLDLITLLLLASFSPVLSIVNRRDGLNSHAEALVVKAENVHSRRTRFLRKFAADSGKYSLLSSVSID